MWAARRSASSTGSVSAETRASGKCRFAPRDGSLFSNGTSRCADAGRLSPSEPKKTGRLLAPFYTRKERSLAATLRRHVLLRSADRAGPGGHVLGTGRETDPGRRGDGGRA